MEPDYSTVRKHRAESQLSDRRPEAKVGRCSDDYPCAASLASPDAQGRLP
jgi:hypothetical protein